MQLNLASGESLQAVMSGAAGTTNPHVRVDYLQDGALQTAWTQLSGATAVTLLSGKTGSVRVVTGIYCYNIDSAAVTITITHVGAATYTITKQTLQVADTLVGDKVVDTNGQTKTSTVSSSVDLADDANMVFGTDDDVYFVFSTADASNPTFVMALDNASQQLHITDKGAVATDWNLAAVTHPTVYLHSNTTPATDYLEIGGHDGTTAHVDVQGGTTLELRIAGTAAANILATGITLPAGQDLIFVGTTGQCEIQITDNLADALSCKIIAGADIYAVDTTTGAVVFSFGATVRVNVLGDAQIGSATTDLVAFHGATPTDQCAAYTQTFATADRTHAARTAVALTDNTAGTANTTLQALADGAVYANDVAAIRNNFADLAAAVNALIADLADTASVVNAIVDDLQEKGLAG